MRSEGAGLAAERPRDDAPDGVLAVHHRAHRYARRVQLRLGYAIDVCCQLQDGVLRRVEDHAAVAQRLGTVVGEHCQAVVGTVADQAQRGRLLERGDDVVGKAVWVGRQRRRRDRAHELPVAAGRILAVALRREPSVQRGRSGRRNALQRQDAAQPEAPEHGQVQAADRLREMAERIRTAVAVVAGVGQLTSAAGIRDDDERPPAHGRGAISFGERRTGRNVCSSTRGKSFVGANASTTTSALWP